MRDISKIYEYYNLSEIIVDTDKLLLDPKNPRINTGSEIYYNEEELMRDDVQDEIYQSINKNAHHINELILNIKRSGFNSGISTFIVKELKNTEKYLVIEGNRRTTAIKHIKECSEEISSSVIDTIKKIKVQKFTYINNIYFSEDEIIDIILGKIHIAGPLAWGAIEKAYYIYKTYMRELKKEPNYRGYDTFYIDPKCITIAGEIFNLKQNEIRKNLKIYSVYSQLRKNGYEVDNNKYSLIDISVNDKYISEDYFGLDAEYCMSEIGMERFSNLCLESGCPITNPKNMRDFIKIRRKGNEEDIFAVENGIITVEEAYYEYKQKQNNSNFVKRLKDIKRKIEKLNIHEFQNSNEERIVTKEIITILKAKLIPLFNENQDNNYQPEVVDIDEPKDVFEATGMNSDKLQQIILDTINCCINGTCKKDDVATKVLKYLKIRSRGEPRAVFCDRVKKELSKLIEEKRLKQYKAKNIRLKVI
jgi:hypothetical protein